MRNAVRSGGLHTFPVLIALLLAPAATADDAAALRAALRAVDAELKPEHYTVARADLDDDGRADFLVYTNGLSGYCGSGGCTLFVLRATGEKAELLGSVSVVQPPVLVRKAKSHGVRDLLVGVSGGGAAAGFGLLRYDGKSYPKGAGETRAERRDDDVVALEDPISARVGAGAEDGPPAAGAFQKSLTQHGITFDVRSPNVAAANTVTVQPAGLTGSNEPLSVAVVGKVTGAEVGDLDADGSPEVYIYAVDSSDGQRGRVIAYAANRKKSLSMIWMPPLEEDGTHSRGYRGQDEFAVLEGALGRRFPVFGGEGNSATPTGKTRQLQYKLVAGEAGWRLKVDRVSEF